MESGERFVPRLVGLDPDIQPKIPDVPLGISRGDLALIATRAFDTRQEPDLDHLELDLPSVDAAIADLQARVGEGIETDFEALVDHLNGSTGLIAYFLALLELVRWGAVRISQADELAPIRVAHNPDAPPEGMDALERVSEWAS